MALLGKRADVSGLHFNITILREGHTTDPVVAP